MSDTFYGIPVSEALRQEADEIRNQKPQHLKRDYLDGVTALMTRAAAHIEALEARVAELEGPCSFCLEIPGHGASRPICDGCAQLATDQAKTSRDLVDRIAALEAEWADAIPRAVLVGSLRKRLRQATAPGGASCSSDMRRDAIAETLRGLIREIERGEWPGEGER